MEWFNCTDPEQMLIIAAIIAIGISKNLSIDEINGIGNFLQLVGGNLITIATQRALNQEYCSPENNHSNKDIANSGSEEILD